MTRHQITLEEALAANLSPEDLKAHDRRPHIYAARAKAMHRMQAELRISTTAIGAHFNRHHTTVIHAIAKHRRTNGIATMPRGWHLSAKDMKQ